ncbi:reverse transcriptase domain-containing protein [Tanacetum coccineum]|uniref:Reverse transcriptase domain-containing protein n=1 Tax=Tanacetum coccineum TaxID=301880 RepID=A0ABQ4WF71_9ASTR
MNMLANLTIHRQSPLGSGSLPSDTVANLRGDVKAITTRSGVAYEGPSIPPTSSSLPKEVEQEPEVTRDKVQTTSSESTVHVHPLVVRDPIPEPEVVPKPNLKPLIPYPSRLNNQKLQEKTNNQMMNLLSNKEKLFELASTPLNENCSALLLKKLPEKLGDLSKFLIPCDFPELVECLALADLGASIDLMPLSVWKKLSLLDLTPTRMTLELANRSVAYLFGVAKDVFVKVGKFHFLADFVVVDYDVDPRVPLILETFLEDGTSINRYVACEEYAQEVLGFLDSSTRRDFILQEIETFPHTPDKPSTLDDDYYDTEGDILYLEKFLNEDPSPNLPPMKNEDLKEVNVTMTKPFDQRTSGTRAQGFTSSSRICILRRN